MRIQITGGRLVDPANQIDRVSDVFIDDGKIVAIGKAPAGFSADEKINATNQIVSPGFVDLYASLREPGFTHKGTIESEVGAAAAGGITTICYMPDSKPIIDSSAVAKTIIQKAQAADKASVLPVAALTRGLGGQQICEMATMKDAGCVAVSNAMQPIVDTQVMRRAMEYAANTDLPVLLYSEDSFLRGKGCAHEGPVATRLGLSGIPENAETMAVARDLALAELTGARIHFCKLSSARAVQLVRRAQEEGVAVTASVTAHHLHLIDVDVAGFNSNTHVRPPLRSARDRDGLREGLSNGVIAAICSDHQPHDLDAKLAPFGETESGVSGFETLLPLSLRLVHDQILTMSRMVEILTSAPARILGIQSGRLNVGDAADICVFDPNEFWTVNESTWMSRGRNTAFFGRELQGRVKCTIYRGRVVYQS